MTRIWKKPFLHGAKPGCLFGALAAVIGLLGCDDEGTVVRVHEPHGLERNGELVSVTVKAEGPLMVQEEGGDPVPSQVVGDGEERSIWFPVDIAAEQSRVYRIVPGKAQAPDRPLKIEGETSKQEDVSITNAFFEARLKAPSGNFDRITLHGKPEIFNRIGTVHWNPGVKADRGWLHTYQWDPPPGLKEWRGELVFETRRKGDMPKYPEIDVDLRYWFSATEPYVIMQSKTTMKQPLTLEVLRNGEQVFDPDLFSHVACKDRQGKIHAAEIPAAAEMEFPSLPDDDWLAFYNPKTGHGMATIRLKVENKGPEGTEATLRNYRMQITRYDNYVYWARVLVWPGDDSETLVPAGNVYFEREAWLPFLLTEDSQGRPEKMLAPVEDTAQRLFHPLEVEIIDQ